MYFSDSRLIRFVTSTMTSQNLLTCTTGTFASFLIPTLCDFLAWVFYFSEYKQFLFCLNPCTDSKENCDFPYTFLGTKFGGN